MTSASRGNLSIDEQRALLARKLKEKSQTAQSAGEPIAVVGIGCRFPRANGPDQYWANLRDGVDATREIPADRWDFERYYDPTPGTAGKMYVRKGGFLERVDEFDPRVFCISPRECESMDPQQRLLLEVTWEALEHAGQDPTALVGTKTGVFVGISNSEYADIRRTEDLSHVNPYTGTGTAYSVAAGRISYVLGLRGPAVSLDTACSSSLVAIHLACASLRSGESSLAIAGGVNLILSPESTIYFSHVRVLSPEGRCKTFDRGADGYARAEGCGVVVLKRLKDAIAAGDHVIAVIRGSAVNHDGQSGGLTVPNGLAQQELILSAIASAGLTPADISYVEAHGTATQLGDSVELSALKGVFGRTAGARQPLGIGSVKTNMGHTEAAAGVAGVIKIALSLQNRLIPPHLHFTELNPNASLDEMNGFVPTVPTPWHPTGRRYAGVSSFGISGTNAHIVLEEAPEQPAPAPGDHVASEERALLLPLSAASTESLQSWARSLRDRVSRDALSLPDICYTAQRRRAHLGHRAAIVFQERGELLAGLDALASGQAHSGLVVGQQASARDRRVVFVFPGQGSQWIGMARELLAHNEAFRVAFEACDRAIRAEAGWSPLEEIARDEADSRILKDIAVVQPVLAATQIAIAAAWRALGVVPDAIIGQSMGEVAAAHVAGAISLEDAVRVICRRSALMKRLSGTGAMAVVELSVDEARAVLRGREHLVSVAVSASPRSTVLSGDPAAMDEILAELQKREVFARRVKVDVASHSPQMDALRHDILRALDGVASTALSVPMYSTVTGQRVRSGELGSDYWMRNLREPVLLSPVVNTLLTEGKDVFIEISPHPVLLPNITQGASDAGKPVVVIPSGRRERSDRITLLEGIATLHVAGIPIDWSKINPPGCRLVDLPTYAWHHERYWFDKPDPRAEGSRKSPRSWALALDADEHPLLGFHLSSSVDDGTHYWQGVIDLATLPHLEDHRVKGAVVLPGAAYVEMALAAARSAYGEGAHELSALEIRSAFIVPKDGGRATQVVLSRTSERAGGEVTFEVRSRDTTIASTGAKSWERHASGAIKLAAPGTQREAHATVPALGELRARLHERVTDEEHYAFLAQLGLEYGPAFRALREAWRGPDEGLGRLAPADSLRGFSARDVLTPALLDAGLQLIATVAKSNPELQDAFVPVGLGRVQVLRPGSDGRWVYTRLRGTPERKDEFEADVTLLDEEGRVVAQVERVTVRRLEAEHEQASNFASWLLHLEWQPQPWSAPATSANARGATWIVFSEGERATAEVLASLRQRGARCVIVEPGPSFAAIDTDRYQVSPTAADDMSRLLAEVTASVGRAGGQPLRGLVHLWSLRGGRGASGAPGSPAKAHDLGCRSALALVQAALRAGLRDDPQLWLVTSGAHAVLPDDPVSVEQAPLNGFVRALAHECPELHGVQVDLGVGTPEADLRLLGALLAAETKEDMIAIRDGSLHVARLGRLAHESIEAAEVHVPEVGRDGEPTAFRLATDRPGILDRLKPELTERRPPGPGEVEIEVWAAGLNFADVMKAMGLYPGAGPNPALGGECAGRIVRCGPGVDHFSVGDEVIGIGASCFAAFVTLRTETVFRKPKRLSMAEAAGIPIAFLTAEYALNHLGHLAAGERALIHSATGGVGLAAIQLVRAAGADVLATAGTEEKRAMLRAMGIACVGDSRSLDFASDVRAYTNGEGVDVVLNSLTGRAITTGLDLLRPFGRFIEIGKADIYGGASLPFGAFRKNISLSSLDLERALRERPAFVASMMRGLLDKLERGSLTPLAHKSYPIASAADAFSDMAQAKHVGKIILTIREEAQHATAPRSFIVKRGTARFTAHPNGTYLVSGGLGALGLKVAAWLADRGAKHLALLARTPENRASDSARRALADLRGAGVRVETFAVDVADAAALSEAHAQIEQRMPPLRGVFHAAGLLEDGLIVGQQWSRFAAVFAPKIDGAWNLHQLTRTDPVDLFVLFSSASSLMGSPGQSNYGAANAFMDALAHHRASLGLPALSINWGPWSEIGLAAREDRGGRLAFRGFGSITPDDGIAALDWLVTRPLHQVGVIPLDIRLWRQFYPKAAELPFLSGLVSAPEASAASAETTTLRKELAALSSWTAQRPVLEAHVQEQVAQVLRIPQGRMDRSTPLKSLGFDSLMALELRNRLEASLGVKLSATMVWNYPTVSDLAPFLAQKMGLSTEAAPEVAPAPEAPAADQSLATLLKKMKAHDRGHHVAAASHQENDDE